MFLFIPGLLAVSTHVSEEKHDQYTCSIAYWTMNEHITKINNDRTLCDCHGNVSKLFLDNII